MNPIEVAIVSLLRDRGPMAGREIVAEQVGLDAECVRKLIWEMVLDGRLELTSDIRLTVPPSDTLNT